MCFFTLTSDDKYLNYAEGKGRIAIDHDDYLKEEGNDITQFY